jgi:hypothetical protein
VIDSAVLHQRRPDTTPVAFAPDGLNDAAVIGVAALYQCGPYLSWLASIGFIELFWT